MATKIKATKVRRGPMNIVTNYYGNSGEKLIWVNRAYDEENAVDNAFRYMRRNEYGAFVAEVSNNETGELIAVVIHSVVGEIRTLFRRDPATKVIVTDFSPFLIASIKEGKDNDLIDLLAVESRLEQRLKEHAHG